MTKSRKLCIALSAAAFWLGFSGSADLGCAWQACADRLSVAFAGSLPAVPRTHGAFTRQEIPLATDQPRGTIIISSTQRTLDYVLGNGRAYRYRIAVGRESFGWTGVADVGRKAEWPEWRPPKEMLGRDPSLPSMLPGGPFNPLGARAIYLYQNGRDSLYRIHGTIDGESIGTAASSGCFRMTNRDVMDLYAMVSIGAKVIVK
jgi:lipoprotein-anchoring transpeptidase ErfK/SrfK